MRSAVSLRWIASAAATIAIVLIGAAALAPAPRHRPTSVDGTRPRTPTSAALERAVDRTLAERSARITGTATASDGLVVDLEGATSLTGPEAILLARPSGQPEAAPIEVRTTAEGTWMRTPALRRWIAISPSAPARQAGTGWAETLARIRRAANVHQSAEAGSGNSFAATVEGRPASIKLDARGRIHHLRLARGADTVEVTFSDFGVDVEVRPPDDL